MDRVQTRIAKAKSSSRVVEAPRKSKSRGNQLSDFSPNKSAVAQTPLTRVLTASAVGSALEWYDFYVYGTAAALVFNQLFFPKLSPVTGTLASFATLGVGFIARPFGGLFFGHLGDRIGRKPVLVATLLIVGIGTALIGLLPTYSTIGIWAPVLLVLLRLLQGFASGAEYGGAVLIAIEYAPPGRRGFFGSCPTVGVVVGSLLASAVFALVSTLWKDQLLVWAWRIPFLLSLLLVAFGIYIRMRVNETPVFKELAAKKSKVPRLPVLEAIRSNPRNFFIVVFAQMGQNGLNYTFLVFCLNYMTSQLKIPRNQALLALVIANLVSIVTILLSSALSDRIGRRPVYMTAALFTAAMTFPFFWMLTTRSIGLIYLAYFIVSGAGYGAMFGPQAAFYAELFDTRQRYSGFAFARELGTILGGGPAPLISAALAAWLGGLPWGVATYVVILALITATAVYFAPEMYRSDIRDNQSEKAGEAGKAVSSELKA